MKKPHHSLLLFLSVLALTLPPQSLIAQDDGKKDGKAEAAQSVSTEEQVRAIAAKLGEDLGNAVAYKPTHEQIAAIAATTEDAEKLKAYTETIFAKLTPGTPAAKPNQTEIKVTGPDFKDLAGGYSQQRKHFKEGVKIYGFKYVEPGKELGMSFDGLFQVEGKWVFIPKAWRAFRE